MCFREATFSSKLACSLPSAYSTHLVWGFAWSAGGCWQAPRQLTSIAALVSALCWPQWWQHVCGVVKCETASGVTLTVFIHQRYKFVHRVRGSTTTLARGEIVLHIDEKNMSCSTSGCAIGNSGIADALHFLMVLRGCRLLRAGQASASVRFFDTAVQAVPIFSLALHNR